jgi:hypothetical protein
MNIIIERFTGKPFCAYTVGCLEVGRSTLGWKRVSVSFKSFQEAAVLYPASNLQKSCGKFLGQFCSLQASGRWLLAAGN